MNDALIKQPDATTTETQPAELPTPHFDEIAVTVARPVEPIAPRVHDRRWLAFLDRPWTILPIVFITAMMGITALALTLQLRDQPHVDTAASEIQTEQKAPEPAPQIVADNEEQKSRPQRSKTNRVRARRNDDNSKPVARRVGVIVYGNSHRP